MIIGPKYKIARRLGATVFEKTQNQKYSIRALKKAENAPRRGVKSEYGLGMLEKQKARYSYGITSKQFSKYVKQAIEKRGNSSELLIRILEGRLDNVALKSGFAPTRQAARQLVSHGHLTVNGKIVTIPSYEVSVGDIVGIREGSKKKALFATLDERLKTVKIPSWLKLNFDKKEITVDGIPNAPESELLFNVSAVLEFYSR
jgi:small subunit ribosomal protein S4